MSIDISRENEARLIATARAEGVSVEGVVSMLDKFPGICYNRLWTYWL